MDEFRHAVDKFEGQWSWGKKKQTTFFFREFRWAIGAEPCVPLSLALSPSSDLEHEEQSGAPFSQLLIKKQTFLNPPDTAPTYFLPPHPPDTHSREGVQLPCVHFFYILFLDRPLSLAQKQSRERLSYPALREVSAWRDTKMPHGTWQHAWRLMLHL